MSELHVSLEVPRLSCSQRLGKSWLWEVLGPRPKAEGPGGQLCDHDGPLLLSQDELTTKSPGLCCAPEGYLFWGALFVFVLRHYFFCPGGGGKKGRKARRNKEGRKEERTNGGRKEGGKKGRTEGIHIYTYIHI